MLLQDKEVNDIGHVMISDVEYFFRQPTFFIHDRQLEGHKSGRFDFIFDISYDCKDLFFDALLLINACDVSCG